MVHLLTRNIGVLPSVWEQSSKGEAVVREYFLALLHKDGSLFITTIIYNLYYYFFCAIGCFLAIWTDVNLYSV